MAGDSFNADFYVTVATVIPILYLVLTLQGNIYKGLLDRMADYAKALDASTSDERRSRRMRGMWAVSNLAFSRQRRYFYLAPAGKYLLLLR